MTTRDRRVLAALQALLLGLPLFLGGRHPLAVVVGGILVTILLVVTERARRDVPDAPAAPGVAALAAFALVALAMTLPLPVALLRLLDPMLAERTAQLLPGWPATGGWSVWRSLAMDPYGVTVELARIAIGLGAFAVIVAYPWRNEEWGADASAQVFGRLLLTAIAGGVLLATLALVEQVAGNGHVLWLTNVETAQRGRASGSFVNPNHLAAWLEMTFAVALTYALALAARLHRRLARAAHSARGMGVHARRAWISAVIAHQRMLWPPLAAATAATLILVAHLATGSRGGTAALVVGIAVAGGGAASMAWRDGRRRWIPLVAALALIVASLGSLALWAAVDSESSAVAESADVGLGTRLAVSAAGTGIIRDYPLVGTGLGSWFHAFRPYQAPPVPGGIWDHAHDDYVELAAETGLVGIAVALLFAFAVARAARPERRDGTSRDGRALVARRTNGGAGTSEMTTSETRGGELSPAHGGALRVSSSGGPTGLGTSEWRAALGERTLLRFGLAGAVAAILVHSLVDFGLRMPANLLLLMIVLALLVVSGRKRVGASCRGLLPLAAAIALTIAPQILNTVRHLAGAAPLAPRDGLDLADLRMAEDADGGRDHALALVHAALDRNPFDRDAHEALASTLDEGPEAEAALRRALVLEPWSATLRDRLGLALWARGEHTVAAAELEESMRRLPSLEAHAYLSPETRFVARDPGQLLRTITDGDTVQLRLANLAPEMTAAVERGLAGALDSAVAGPERASIVDDLATLLEVGERWSAAATLLHDEAQTGAADGTYLTRAARDYLRAHADGRAEETLLAALVQAPDQGDLYRKLAVDVYAARGDFKTADIVLTAAQQNAVDMLPVYRGVNEVLSRRDAARVDEVIDDEVVDASDASSVEAP